MQKNQFIDIMKKTLSKFVKENLGKKVLILKFNVEGEIVGYNSKLKAIIIRSFDKDFGWRNESSVYEETNKMFVKIDKEDVFWYVEYYNLENKIKTL